MRGADTFTEGLFTVKKLDDFVPANHPLRVIRTMVNKALAEMGELFAKMYEEDAKGGRPSIAPEKLLRAMLLQVLYTIRAAHPADPAHAHSRVQGTCRPCRLARGQDYGRAVQAV